MVAKKEVLKKLIKAGKFENCETITEILNIDDEETE
jgi:hypothetical protein